VLGGLVLALSGSFVYTQNEDFSHHVDMTFNPELLEQETEFAQATGLDDGNRFKIFVNESSKLTSSPLFGSGLFHRGGRSRLYTTGSHNFFLQMFLETGIVGGAAMVLFFRRLWQLSKGTLIEGARNQLGTQAALIAAIAGGLTGEYFYGGPVLLMLIVLAAPALSSATAAAPIGAPNPETRIGPPRHA
jgi:O-antigen ligase